MALPSYQPPDSIWRGTNDDPDPLKPVADGIVNGVSSATRGIGNLFSGGNNNKSMANQNPYGNPYQASMPDSSGQDDPITSIVKGVYNTLSGNNSNGVNYNAPQYNTPTYSGTDAVPTAIGANAYTQQQARDQANWQAGQQLNYNDALNAQRQRDYQQFSGTNNAIANAKQQRDLVQNSANTLNNIYGNSMSQMNAAAANTQNSLGNLANTAASMFR